LRRGVVFLVLCVLCFLLVSGFCVQCRAASETDAQSAVNEASQRIVTCYEEVTSASSAGANVSALLPVLNTAGDLLSRAQLAFASGDFNSSSALALQSEQALEGFDVQAESLKSAAEHTGFVGFWVDVVGSSVGAVAVLVLGFAVWRLLRKKYPEVT